MLPQNDAPIVAASDYGSALPALIPPWVWDRMISLGTNGFGRSDTLAALRRFFEGDSKALAMAALAAIGASPLADGANPQVEAGPAPWLV